MSHRKNESLHFYKYLCQKIGSEEVVRARRLSFLNADLGSSVKSVPVISSGSRGEGLNLKGSDLDMMIISNMYAVYESDEDVVQNGRTVLVMDTDDTHPCFTYLRFCDNYFTTPYFIKQNLRQHRGDNLLSNELFKSQLLNFLSYFTPKLIDKIHGPCLSDYLDQMDAAFCLKADKWVSQAQPWISRSRLKWPTPELISKITSWGVLFVPIGYKGSINENLQWRISFSVAEKILIFSFRHTQLLCYALLKILLKEIVDLNDNLKGLLCSYFLKTLMFWISEETETSVWRPDNIIPCFMACLKRLLYCIEYSTLLHYFIPDNNLFYLRFDRKNKYTLINILKNSCQTGIQIFSSSQTLHDYRRFPCEISRSVCEISSIFKTIKEIEQTLHIHVFSINIVSMFNILLHHCKTELSRSILTLSTAAAYQKLPFALLHVNNPNNKQQYKIYKHDLSQLLVGVHSDSVSGMLILASFFYVRKNYLASIDIVNYTLSNCTNELSLSKITSQHTNKLKLLSLLKKQPSQYVSLNKRISNSSVIPMELKSQHTKEGVLLINSIPFAHFLRFLCCYHLQDFKSCQYCIIQFQKAVNEYRPPEEASYGYKINNFISLGIAFQMFGRKDRARTIFRLAANADHLNYTSAAYRLNQLR